MKNFQNYFTVYFSCNTRKVVSAILILPSLFILIILKFNIIILQDTQFIFEHFKYFSDYYNFYKKFPLWIPEIRFGIQSFALLTYVGAPGILLSYLSGLLDLNAFNTFLFLIIFYYSTFFYGIYLCLKDEKFNFTVFVFLILLFLLYSTFFSGLHFHLIFNLSVPYVFYWTKKYFQTFKIINLSKVYFILFFQFFCFNSYTIVVNVYFFIFLFLFLALRNFNNLNLKVIFLTNNKKDYLFFILSISLLIFARFLTHYFFDYHSFAPEREADNTSTFEVFQNYGNRGIWENFYSFLTGSTTYALEKNYGPKDINFSFGSLYLVFLIYLIFLKISHIFKKNNFWEIENDNTRIIFYIVIFILILSFLNIYVIDLFFYELPLFSYYRHKTYISSITQPFVFMICYYGLNNIFENRYHYKILNISALFLCIFYLMFLSLVFILNKTEIIQSAFNIFEFPKFQNNVTEATIFSNFIAVFLILIFINFNLINGKIKMLFKYNLKNNFYYIYILVPFLAVSNFYVFVERNNKVLKDYEFYNYNKINFNRKDLDCISESKFKDLYSHLHQRKNSASYLSSIYNYGNFTCKHFMRADIGQNKKSINLYFDKVSRYIKKINNEEYEISFEKDHITERILNISYHKKWRIEKSHLIENFQGYIKVKNYNNSNSVRLKFEYQELIYAINAYIFFGLIFFFIYFNVLLNVFRNKGK